MVRRSPDTETSTDLGSIPGRSAVTMNFPSRTSVSTAGANSSPQNGSLDSPPSVPKKREKRSSNSVRSADRARAGRHGVNALMSLTSFPFIFWGGGKADLRRVNPAERIQGARDQ